MENERSSSRGLSWPDQFQPLKPLIEDQWRTTDDIYLIRQLSGGKSGAQVYLADVTSENFTGQAILKLEMGVDPEWIEKSEANRHRQAYEAEPGYSHRHLPQVVQSTHDEERIAILSTVAARGLEFALPWSEANHSQQVEVLKKLASSLLEDWNAKARMAHGLIAPQFLLRSWLAHRLDKHRGRLHETSEVLCGIPSLERSFVIEGRWLPNPLAFCLDNPEAHSGNRIRAIEGHVHGDLHGQNVLVSQTGSSKNHYYMIDLAFFEQRQYLFFDHTYFAVSQLLARRGNVSDSRWLSIADEMCPFEHLKRNPDVLSDDVGLTNMLKSLRSEVVSWVDRHHAHRLSYMEAQFQLSQVAASLNFANKRIKPELRRLAFIHAATVLRDYIELHNVDWPKYGPQISETATSPICEQVTSDKGSNTPSEPIQNEFPSLSDGPSIAVMEFENLSGQDNQRFFVQGLSDEVITELSSVDWLMVISRGSSFNYKSGVDDPKKVGRELGVHYVVEGTVLKIEERIRVSVKLVDTATGKQLWADRFDRRVVDLLELQQEIATIITARIETQLKRTERESASKKIGDVTQWESLQRAMWHFYQRTEEDSQKAREILSLLTDHGSTMSGAFAASAILEARQIAMGRAKNVGDTLQIALRNAQRSVELDENNSLARLSLSRVYSLQGKYDQAVFEATASIDLNPSSSVGHLNLGAVLIYGGRAQEAILPLEKSIRLSPKGPMLNLKRVIKAFILYFLNDSFKAEQLLLPVASSRYLSPFSYLFLAAVHVKDDRPDDARSALQEALRLRPDFSKDWFRKYWRAFVPEYRDKLVGDLERAGLPKTAGSASGQ